MPYRSADNLRFWEFEIFQQYEELTCLFSTIQNSDSKLNLGFTKFADVDEVRKNRELFFKAAGTSADKIAVGKQIHSRNVRQVNEPGMFDECDGLITSKKDLSLIVSAADCLPLFLYDSVKKVCSVVHCGWRGTRDAIAEEAVRLMLKLYGCDPRNIKCGIGPSIEASCFEVSSEVADQFDSMFLTPSKNDKMHLNLKEVVRKQLEKSGILPENIEVSDICNKCDEENYFSYRRDGDNSGRMWGLMRINP